MVISKKKLYLVLLVSTITFPLSPFARTVNIYVENKTHDPIYTMHDKQLQRIDAGKVKLVGSQERKPAHYHNAHYIPDVITAHTDIFLLNLNEPLTLTTTTSSAPVHGIGKGFVKRDRLEWVVCHSSQNIFKDLSCVSSCVSSLSRYPANKAYSSAYIVRGQKKGSDFHGFPAADLYFTIEETLT